MVAIYIIYYLVIATISTSLIMMQIVKGCKNPKYDTFKITQVNVIYSIIIGWLVFIPTVFVYLRILGKIHISGATWDDVWKEIDDITDEFDN